MECNALISHIQRYTSLNNEEAELLQEYVELHELKKKSFLLKEGHVCTGNYFVIDGLLRSYFMTDKDVEQVHLFALEGWWITDYHSLERNTPSQFYIQAVEDSVVAEIPRNRQDELFDRLPQLEKYFRIVLQNALAATQTRVKLMKSISGEERYLSFARMFPGFVQRVPQYMLASYLGITPEFLSKVRAKKIS